MVKMREVEINELEDDNARDLEGSQYEGRSGNAKNPRRSMAARMAKIKAKSRKTADRQDGGSAKDSKNDDGDEPDQQEAGTETAEEVRDRLCHDFAGLPQEQKLPYFACMDLLHRMREYIRSAEKDLNASLPDPADLQSVAGKCTLLEKQLRSETNRDAVNSLRSLLGISKLASGGKSTPLTALISSIISTFEDSSVASTLVFGEPRPAFMNNAFTLIALNLLNVVRDSANTLLGLANVSAMYTREADAASAQYMSISPGLKHNVRKTHAMLANVEQLNRTAILYATSGVCEQAINSVQMTMDRISQSHFMKSNPLYEKFFRSTFDRSASLSNFRSSLSATLSEETATVPRIIDTQGLEFDIDTASLEGKVAPPDLQPLFMAPWCPGSEGLSPSSPSHLTTVKRMFASIPGDVEGWRALLPLGLARREYEFFPNPLDGLRCHTAFPSPELSSVSRYTPPAILAEAAGQFDVKLRDRSISKFFKPPKVSTPQVQLADAYTLFGFSLLPPGRDGMKHERPIDASPAASAHMSLTVPGLASSFSSALRQYARRMDTQLPRIEDVENIISGCDQLEELITSKRLDSAEYGIQLLQETLGNIPFSEGAKSLLDALFATFRDSQRLVKLTVPDTQVVVEGVELGPRSPTLRTNSSTRLSALIKSALRDSAVKIRELMHEYSELHIAYYDLLETVQLFLSSAPAITDDPTGLHSYCQAWLGDMMHLQSCMDFICTTGITAKISASIQRACGAMNAALSNDKYKNDRSLKNFAPMFDNSFRLLPYREFISSNDQLDSRCNLLSNFPSLESMQRMSIFSLSSMEGLSDTDPSEDAVKAVATLMPISLTPSGVREQLREARDTVDFVPKFLLPRPDTSGAREGGGVQGVTPMARAVIAKTSTVAMMALKDLAAKEGQDLAPEGTLDRPPPFDWYLMTAKEGLAAYRQQLVSSGSVDAALAGRLQSPGLESTPQSNADVAPLHTAAARTFGAPPPVHFRVPANPRAHGGAHPPAFRPGNSYVADGRRSKDMPLGTVSGGPPPSHFRVPANPRAHGVVGSGNFYVPNGRQSKNSAVQVSGVPARNPSGGRFAANTSLASTPPSGFLNALRSTANQNYQTPAYGMGFAAQGRGANTGKSAFSSATQQSTVPHSKRLGNPPPDGFAQTLRKQQAARHANQPHGGVQHAPR